MAQFNVAEEKIGNTVYKAQFNGIGAALRAVDNSYIEGSSNTSLEKLSKYLFENVIVEPKGLTADDFDNMEDFNKVVSFAREVMDGSYFRKEKVKKQANEGSKG